MNMAIKGEGERAAKKLQSSEADLKVVLGSNTSGTNLWYHSQTLATKSKYIDASLSSSTTADGDEKLVRFPDIKLDIWQQMMKFLDSPVAAMQMTVKDAMNLATFYDKYEFEEGKKLCSHFMVQYFKSTKDMEGTYSIDIDFIIDMTIVAYKANLEDAFKEGISYIWCKVDSHECPYGMRMFTEDHLTKLKPILKYSVNESRRLGLHNTIGAWRTTRTTFYLRPHYENETGLDDADFEKDFVTQCERQEQHRLLVSCISQIEISGSDLADGKYKYEYGSFVPTDDKKKKTKWIGDKEVHRDEVTFRVVYWEKRGTNQFSGGNGNPFNNFVGWAICRHFNHWEYDSDGPFSSTYVSKKCWVAPHSKNKQLPPFEGWISADPLVKGNPKIKYILNECVDSGKLIDD